MGAGAHGCEGAAARGRVRTRACTGVPALAWASPSATPFAARVHWVIGVLVTWHMHLAHGHAGPWARRQAKPSPGTLARPGHPPLDCEVLREELGWHMQQRLRQAIALGGSWGGAGACVRASAGACVHARVRARSRPLAPTRLLHTTATGLSVVCSTRGGVLVVARTAAPCGPAGDAAATAALTRPLPALRLRLRAAAAAAARCQAGPVLQELLVRAPDDLQVPLQVLGPVVGVADGVQRGRGLLVPRGPQVPARHEAPPPTPPGVGPAWVCACRVRGGGVCRAHGGARGVRVRMRGRGAARGWRWQVQQACQPRPTWGRS